MTIGKEQYPYSCYAKLFCRYDPGARMVRLGRLVWARGRLMKGGYTAKLSLALRPALIGFSRDWEGWSVTLCGVRLHYQRSYGGAIC